jgi:hypothetical protein
MLTAKHQGAGMIDRFLKWAEAQRDQWTRAIALMEAGQMFTFEERGQGRLDTTRETLVEYRKLVDGLNDLIAKARDAKRT